MGALLIGLLFGVVGGPVWLLILVLGWYSLGRHKRKLTALEEGDDVF